MTPKIFGREPAVISSLIEAALALAISFHLLAWAHIGGQAELALVMAVVSSGLGLYVAWVTRATLLGVAIGLIKALIALAAVYGLTISVEQTGTLIAFLTVLIGLFHRTQTTPLAQPAFDLAA
jgi:hypothetical protein